MYTFSDGYPDQFGGENGQKFMTKRFRETLASIQDKSMAEQKQILEQTFENWKREIDQVDDVLIVGAKI